MVQQEFEGGLLSIPGLFFGIAYDDQAGLKVAHLHQCCGELVGCFRNHDHDGW